MIGKDRIYGTEKRMGLPLKTQISIYMYVKDILVELKGKKSYSSFIEELLESYYKYLKYEKGIKKLIKKRKKKKEKKISG